MTLLSTRTRDIWLSYLASAFRTGIACAIVGAITTYGPASINTEITFPAFSYVVVILIVTDATLGDTLRGCWHALYATVQGVCPAILSLYFLGPSKLNPTTTTFAVALSAFVVALPEWTHLVSKRIALGQIVIVYVVGFIKGEHTEAVMHPIHVAISTGVGVVACVLALLLPYPSLASYQVKQNCMVLAENVSKRVHLYVKAICAEDSSSALAFVSQAKSLSATAAKLLHLIKSKQESMQWERLPFKFLELQCKNPGERFQELETPLRGMEIALSNPDSLFPPTILNHDLKDSLHKLEEHTSKALEKLKTFKQVDMATSPETILENIISIDTNIQPTQKDLPSLFFLFCFKLLQIKLLSPSLTNIVLPSKTPTEPSKKDLFSLKWISTSLGFEGRFLPAFKCSLSLGLAVTLGLMYSKENGFWAALPAAISYAAAREPTFKVANLKAQGTVLGTVYGVLACFVFEKFVNIRFISLFPWFIICSILRKSRMYGQVGGISAVIGAVLILGRLNFGEPSDFAIARIVETYIGLTCTIMVEILFKPKRASTLAKLQLSKTFKILHECIGEVSLGGSKKGLGDSHKKLKGHLNELREFIEEAEVEPNFWALPFNSACYNKLFRSLSNMVELLFFARHAIELLNQESGRFEMENENKVDGQLEVFKEMVCPSIKCFEEIILVKSLSKLDKELQNNEINNPCDVELGNFPIPKMLKSSSKDVENEIGNIVDSLLKSLKEMVFDNVNDDEDMEELDKVNELAFLSISALAYTITGLTEEAREVEKGLKELIQWENPTFHVNLYEINCKIQALYD